MSEKIYQKTGLFAIIIILLSRYLVKKDLLLDFYFILLFKNSIFSLIISALGEPSCLRISNVSR